MKLVAVLCSTCHSVTKVFITRSICAAFLYQSRECNRRVMSKSFSLYLDLIRFLAALAVFLAHLSSAPFTINTVWWRLGAYGDIAVTLFFVLSGYVIAYVTATRERTPADYFSARIARLYSVVGIALILTFSFDLIGMSVNPGFYSIQKVLWKPASWAGYLSSAVFINEYQIFEFNGISPGTNGPFWSLSFEATYYVVAGLVLFSPRRIWIPASLIVLGAAGRTVVALLPIWALGFMLYHWPGKKQIPTCLWLFLAGMSAAVILAMPTLLTRFPADNFGAWFPWGRAPSNRNILEDYFVASAFALHLISVKNLLSGPAYIQPRITSAVRWLGSQTFPLYCLHYPAICIFAAISPWKTTTNANAIFVSISTLTLIVAMTPLCENLKLRIRGAFNTYFGNLRRTIIV